ncbi:MAG: hypothetical protein K9I95_11500 [Flavobacteriaceae bacterium]|nr:hypothetical protein [Flavobacteriaceae bacterium]
MEYSKPGSIDEKYRIDGIPKKYASKHIKDIKEKDLIQLNIDFEQRGVGGDDSWYSRPQEKYQLKNHEKHTYGFYLIPFENKFKEDLIRMSKDYISE